MNTKKILKRIVIPVLLFNILSYLPFSLSGEYKTSNYGGQDWRTEWHPRFMINHHIGYAGRSKSTHTILGVIYWPCIFLDRMCWHKTEFNVFE